MSNIDFTATSLAAPALSPIEDDDPDCSTLKEFRLDLINSLIADLHLVASVIAAHPETELPPRTWAAISNAYQTLGDSCQNLRN